MRANEAAGRSAKQGDGSASTREAGQIDNAHAVCDPAWKHPPP